MTTSERSTLILRFSLGMTFCLAVAQFEWWAFSFIATILTSTLLQARVDLSWEQGRKFSLLVILACYGGALASELLLKFPFVHIAFLVIAIYHIYYWQARGLSTFVVAMMLIALIVMPAAEASSASLSLDLAAGFSLSAIFAVLVTKLAYVCFPSSDLQQQASTQAKLDIAEAQQAGLRGLFTVAPLVITCFVFNKSDWAIIVVFVAIMMLQPDLESGKKAGVGLVLGNLLGLLVILFYVPLVAMVESYVFMLLCSLFAFIVIAKQLFSGKKLAPLWGVALTAWLVIWGLQASTLGVDADEKIINRVMQMIVAASYVVLANILYQQFGQQWVQRLLSKQD